jgi:PAS domain S-box-containing protein
MAQEEERVRLAAILEATTDFVVLTDSRGQTLYMNRAGRHMLGIDPQEDISGLHESDFRPATARRVEEGIAIAISEGAWSGESVLVTRNGREIPVSQVILAHKDANGEVAFLSAMSRDMTQQRALEERLRRAQEEQTSLRRVATLVAQGAPSTEVFAAVAEEVARVTRVPLVEIARFEPDGTMTVVGHAGDHPFTSSMKVGRSKSNTPMS